MFLERWISILLHLHSSQNASRNNSKLVSRYNLTREPRPKLCETNSSKEAIGAHLMHVNKILFAIKSREDKLSGDAKKKVLDFRMSWKE